MICTFDSLAVLRSSRLVCACIGAALAVCVPSIAEAGAQNIPCRRPFIFQRAAVNVVILPYESATALPGAAGIGERLSGLLQLEVLRSIAKFGSVGAVQMVGSPADCDPDLVVAKLLGRTPGAETMVRKGHGLVVVWGRFYSERGNVFVQTFSRLLRSGVDETFEVEAAGQPFSAQISAQAFAAAPRKVTVEDMRNFEDQFLRSTILRRTPDASAGGFRMPPGPQPYWISDTQGDWMQIASQGGVQGWIQLSGARDRWSLARWLPELTYIEGAVGYLRARIAAQQSSPVPAQWIEHATRALSEPERGLELQASESSATALASAVPLQLRGILGAMKSQNSASPESADDRVNALKLFERAAAILPNDANARNIVAMMQLSLALGSGHPGLSPKQAADDLLQALGTDPGNRRLLANLESAYEALLARSASATPLLTDEERLAVSERLKAIKQIRTPKPG